jgi:hypothetical protein
MEKKQPIKRFLNLFDPSGTRKYVTQITLILFSLLIATSVDRCRETAKDRVKLIEYLKAVQADLKGEIETCEMNLNDCEKDMKCLSLTLQNINNPQQDSLEIALTNFASVYWRGVFRAFPPTTFEMMGETGDANLLKNLELRNGLASVFAFRRTVVKQDLEKFDQQTEVCAEKMGAHVDLTKLLYTSPFDASCILDRAAFLKSPHNEVFLLLRKANLRAFHLDTAIDSLKEVEQALEAYIKTL